MQDLDLIRLEPQGAPERSLFFETWLKAERSTLGDMHRKVHRVGKKLPASGHIFSVRQEAPQVDAIGLPSAGVYQKLIAHYSPTMDVQFAALFPIIPPSWRAGRDVITETAHLSFFHFNERGTPYWKSRLDVSTQKLGAGHQQRVLGRYLQQPLYLGGDVLGRMANSRLAFDSLGVKAIYLPGGVYQRFSLPFLGRSIWSTHLRTGSKDLNSLFSFSTSLTGRAAEGSPLLLGCGIGFDVRNWMHRQRRGRGYRLADPHPDAIVMNKTVTFGALYTLTTSCTIRGQATATSEEIGVKAAVSERVHLLGMDWGFTVEGGIARGHFSPTNTYTFALGFGDR